MQAQPRSLDALDDAQLVQLARRSNSDALRTIMQRNSRRLYRVARSVLGDDSEAEDVVQEAFVRAFGSLATFRGDARLTTWPTRITLNEALGRLRQRRTTVDLSVLDAEPVGPTNIIPFPSMQLDTDPERAAAQQQIRRLIEAAIDRLPEAFRTVFVMRAIEEMNVEETADLLDIEPATVRTRLHRARRLLRQALEQQIASTLTGAFPFDGMRCTQTADKVLARLRLSTASKS